ncbi:MAG: hypothetical protein LBS81_02075 [Endomicrobium sp.]|jgi:hypothetical protein|nr:hypothetical protein [Endomicrobium sp.]
MSGNVVSIMPSVVMFMMYIIEPDIMKSLFVTLPVNDYIILYVFRSVVFPTVYYMLVNISKMKLAGKVYNAVEKRKNKNFIVPVIMNTAKKLGNLIARVK